VKVVKVATEFEASNIIFKNDPIFLNLYIQIIRKIPVKKVIYVLTVAFIVPLLIYIYIIRKLQPNKLDE
jgi:hypothetical protein